MSKKHRWRYIMLFIVCLYLFSYICFLVNGKRIGKRYGFDNGFVFVDPDAKYGKTINLTLEDAYYPLVYITHKYLNGPYIIHSD
jgi:hypothetical protein